MDRSIHCAFFGNSNVPFTRLSHAIHALDVAMTQLGLDFETHGVGRIPEAFPKGAGRYGEDERMLLFRTQHEFGDNEWTALVVTRYLITLTGHMPGLVIKAHDDGRYFLADDLVLRDGAATRDPERVGSTGGTRDGADFVRTEAPASMVFSPRPDALFATIAAERYASEPAIKALGLTQLQLARMTLDDIAARVVFPWERLAEDAT